MHELSITQNVVQICEEHANGRKVTEVVLLVGELCGAIPESIESCFQACSRGTLAEGARLKVEVVPGLANCPICSKSMAISTMLDSCETCGSYGLQILSGEELRVKEIELL